LLAALGADLATDDSSADYARRFAGALVIVETLTEATQELTALRKMIYHALKRD